jgi:hypothetical protein
MIAGTAFASMNAPAMNIRSPAAAAASANQKDMQHLHLMRLGPPFYVLYMFLSRTKRVHNRAKKTPGQFRPGALQVM